MAADLESEAHAQTFAYDALNRPTSATLPDDTEELRAYNIAGLLESVSAKIRGAATATSIVTNVDYDEKGRRAKIVYANNTETTYRYDPLTFRLSYFQTKRTTDNKLPQSLAYVYDPVGNIVATEDTSSLEVYFDNPPSSPIPDPSNDFTYDAVYRLTQAVGREHAAGAEVQLDWDQIPVHGVPHPANPSGLRAYTQSFAYDKVGNITSFQHAPATGPGGFTRAYTYTSGTNHLVTTTHSSGTRNYGHDAHGNMDEMPHLLAMEWNFADQLKHVEKTTDEHVYFVYDAAGDRVRKVYIHGQYVDTTTYLGGFEIWRRVENGTLKDARETVHIADDRSRVCVVETLTLEGGSVPAAIAPRFRFQLDNHLGTVSVETDEDGAVISYEEYHPYGTSAYRAFHGEVSAKRYRYIGSEHDEETRLYLMGARYYAA